MDECKHGIDERWCASCKGQEPVTLVLEGPTIAARFAAKCSGCGERIFKGEDVHLTDAGWVDSACARRAVTV